MDDLTAFIELNRKFLVENKQSQSHEGGWSFDRFLDIHNTKENIVQFSKEPSRILSASEHLQGYDSPAELIDELLSRGYSLFEILEMIENSGD